jgi:hypothetical protein
MQASSIGRLARHGLAQVSAGTRDDAKAEDHETAPK